MQATLSPTRCGTSARRSGRWFRCSGRLESGRLSRGDPVCSCPFRSGATKASDCPRGVEGPARSTLAAGGVDERCAAWRAGSITLLGRGSARGAAWPSSAVATPAGPHRRRRPVSARSAVTGWPRPRTVRRHPPVSQPRRCRWRSGGCVRSCSWIWWGSRRCRSLGMPRRSGRSCPAISRRPGGPLAATAGRWRSSSETR
jgi:hypothetical protein